MCSTGRIRHVCWVGNGEPSIEQRRFAVALNIGDEREEHFALRRTDIEDSHVIRERIREVIGPTSCIREGGFRHDAAHIQREGYLCVIVVRIGGQRQP